MTKFHSDPKILQQTMEEIMQRKKKKMDSQPVRVQMLGDVQKIVSRERNVEYGEPVENMDRTAQMLRAYFGSRPGSSIEAHDSAALGIILKLGRLAENPGSMDSWRDVAGYASIGYEIMEQQQPRKRGRPPKQK